MRCCMTILCADFATSQCSDNCCPTYQKALDIANAIEAADKSMKTLKGGGMEENLTSWVPRVHRKLLKDVKPMLPL